MNLFKPIQNIINKRANELVRIKLEKFVDDKINNTMNHSESNYAPEVKEDYSIAMERSIWSYACVHTIATSIAAIPLRLYKKGTDEEVTDGQYWDLINYPNDKEGYYDFMEALVSYLELTGDGFIEVMDSVKNPTAMKVIRSYWMDIEQNKKGEYLYNFKPNGIKQSTLTSDECVHIKYFHPNSELYGFSGMQAATNSLIQDFYVTNYSKKFYEKGGMINTYLSVKSIMQDFEFKRLKSEVKSNLTGMKNAHDVPVFDGDAELKSVNSGAEAILLKTNRDQYRDEILTAFGVPPIMLSCLAGNETYNNSDVQKKVFYEVTVIPKLRKIEGQLNRSIFIKAGLEARFDTKGIAALKEDESKKATTVTTLAKGGIITANEARSIYYDLDPIEGGDVLAPLAPAPSPFGNITASYTGIEPVKKKLNSGINYYLLKQAIETNSKLMEQREQALDKALRPLFTSMMNKVLSKLPSTGISKADYSKTIANSLDGETAEMMKQLIEHNKETMRQSVTSSLKRSSRTARDIDSRSVAIIEANEKHITKWATESADSIIETSKTRLNNYLDRAATEGLEIADVRKGIQEIFEGTDRDSFARAQMIARTETARMVNMGVSQAGKEMGFKKKMWVSTLDSKCRDSHVEANGQTVDIDEPFTVGNSQMMYPGDSSAPPEETINCRCSLLERD